MADGFRLVVDQGSQAGHVFPLDREVTTLGREPGNTIVINEAQVSRQHARITNRGGMLTIEDLGSTNGTFVNGMRLTGPHSLSNGDVIGLSDAVTLTFSGSAMPLVAEAAPSPAPDYGPAPGYAPQMGPSYAPPPYEPPVPQGPPAFEQFEPAPPRKSGKKWIFIGCGLVVLLAIGACLLVFVLDFLGALPAFFYAPLRWLGFI